MRRPLPLFSASLPSGFQIASAKSAPGGGATGTSTPSAPTPKWRSQSQRTRAGVTASGLAGSITR